jgi:hypothetical protein
VINNQVATYKLFQGSLVSAHCVKEFIMSLKHLVALFIITVVLVKSLPAQTQPEVFNVFVYEGIYLDIMNGYGSGNLAGATNHWTGQGLPVEGRRASIIFDPVYYLAHNSDLRAAYGDHGYAAAAQHFFGTGLPSEGRRGSLEFDVKYYIAKNPGVPTTYLAAADDFINYGLPSLGRRGSADFNVQDYINNYPDVAAGYGATDYQDATLHWLRRGKGQARYGFGALPPPTECVQDRTTEFVTVPLPAPSPTPTPATVMLQIAHPTSSFADVSVFYVNPPTGFPAQLQNVSSSTPLRGQYSASNGTYTFSSADAEAPLQVTYKLAPIPSGYSRIFFTHRTSGLGTGTLGDPFDASIMDDTLRFISEQTPGKVPPNNENGAGSPYPQTNLIVCLDNADLAHPFSTRGNYNFLINQQHLNNEAGGFTVNQNWHIHGKGMNNTYVQLSTYVLNDPRRFNDVTNVGLGLVFGTHDDNASGVEISDLTIDENYAALHAANPSISLNLLAVNLRSDLGGHNIHNINVIGFAGEIGRIKIKYEAFPIWITANNNASPLRSANNQIKYVLMSSPPATNGACTGIAVNNAVTEVAYNVVNSWGPGGFGFCIGFGGFQMDSVWFHDNFAFNNTPDGFITDSDNNRSVTVEFNQIINPQVHGINIGGTQVYDYFLIQYNTIDLSKNGTVGILFNGQVDGATVKNNDIVTEVAPSSVKGITFPGLTFNAGSIFEFNQISSRFSNTAVPPSNCAFNNWNEFSVQLSNFPNTQNSPCSAPAQPYATMQTDGNFVIYGPGGVAVWNTATNGTGGVIIRMQDDGNLVIYAEVWQAGTYATPSPGPFPPQTCTIGGNALFAPQTIFSGKCLVSAKGQYILYMAPDGNFYIYDIAHNVGTWGAGTSGNQSATATLQTDGNFVVYSTSHVALWNSGTSGTGADFLELEDDGRIILYKPVWSSSMTMPGGKLPGPVQPPNQIPPTRPACDIGTGTGWTGRVGAGQCFVSPSGRFEMLLQSDGGLMILDLSVNAAQSSQAIWFR